MNSLLYYYCNIIYVFSLHWQRKDGIEEGTLDGEVEGASDGHVDGTREGTMLSSLLGRQVGTTLGSLLGTQVGTTLGSLMSSSLGTPQNTWSVRWAHLTVPQTVLYTSVRIRIRQCGSCSTVSPSAWTADTVALVWSVCAA